jgi:hypothetical protein
MCMFYLLTLIDGCNQMSNLEMGWRKKIISYLIEFGKVRKPWSNVVCKIKQKEQKYSRTAKQTLATVCSLAIKANFPPIWLPSLKSNKFWYDFYQLSSNCRISRMMTILPAHEFQILEKANAFTLVLTIVS